VGEGGEAEELTRRRTTWGCAEEKNSRRRSCGKKDGQGARVTRKTWNHMLTLTHVGRSLSEMSLIREVSSQNAKNRLARDPFSGWA
jgi:hypothetical protein